MNFYKYLILMAAGAAFILGAAGCGPAGSSGMGGAFPMISRSGEPSPVSYTIVLAQLPQEGGFGPAQQLKQQAQILFGFEDIWLENINPWISVNYGHFDQKMGGQAMQRELMRVRQLYPQLALGPYQFCYLKELPQPDPPAPADWYLLNNRCYYTLEIATYYNVPEQGYYNRKTDAVTAVANLRERGEQAYFIHGRIESRVYVGCFANTAVVDTWQGNIQIRQLSPELNQLKKKYQFHENGMKLFDIRRSSGGQEVRLARPVQIRKVEMLSMEIPF